MSKDLVIEALTTQLACYRRLAKLADIQHEHVRQGRTEQLLQVLGSRQEVLSRISSCEEVVGAAKRRWGEYLAGLDAFDQEQAESLLVETRQLLEQITAADQDDALVLQQRKLNLSRQIHQAASARQINRSYAGAAYSRRVAGLDVQR